MKISRVAQYYQLAKPGMVYGNMLPAIAGFALASHGIFNPLQLVGMLVGLGLVMGSSCVVNNIRDRSLDRLMKRTRQRALPQRSVTYTAAIVLSAVLGVVGIVLLYLSSSWIACATAAIGWVIYAGVYTWLKSRSHYATIVGTIPGAIPPIVGWLAGGGGLTYTAAGLFAILAAWQMVHFYTIAIRCDDDYAKAGIPTYTRIYGVLQTVRAIRVYGALYLVAVIGLTVLLPISTGWTLAALGMTHLPFIAALLRRSTANASSWAKQIFLASIAALTTWSLIMTIAALYTQN